MTLFLPIAFKTSAYRKIVHFSRLLIIISLLRTYGINKHHILSREYGIYFTRYFKKKKLTKPLFTFSNNSLINPVLLTLI